MSRLKLVANARFVELRFAKAHRFVPHSQCDHEYSNYLLSLDKEPKALFRSFHKSCIQRAINKAKREALEIVTGKTEQDMKAFYRLHLTTRKKHGVPIQPYRFFRNLWNALTPRDMSTLLLARYQDKVVASIIVLWFNGIAYYKFGASDEKALPLRANQLLMWHSIRLARKRGCRTFDFGRASCANKGLAQYKSRWGTQKVPLPYLQLPKVKKSGVLIESSKKHALLKGIMMRMPQSIIHLSGELFYKHFA